MGRDTETMTGEEKRKGRRADERAVECQTEIESKRDNG